MQIKCDKCGLLSDRINPETARNGDIEFTFLRCPECGKAYPVAATDTALRADIAEYSRRRQLIRMKPVTEAFLRETEKLKEQNMERNRELMGLHSLVPFFQPGGVDTRPSVAE